MSEQEITFPYATRNPEEAVAVLFEHALPSVPDAHRMDLDMEYDDLRPVWRSERLINGSAEEIKARVLTNLKQIPKQYEAAGARSASFNIINDVNNSSGVQVNIHFSKRGFGSVPIRVWRAGTIDYVCGNFDFS